jgi:hypothetical protein
MQGKTLLADPAAVNQSIVKMFITTSCPSISSQKIRIEGIKHAIRRRFQVWDFLIKWQIKQRRLLPVALSLLIQLPDELFKLRPLFRAQNRADALAPLFSDFTELRFHRLLDALHL